MSVLDERDQCKSKFEQGGELKSPVLDDYRKNRDSRYWRASKVSEEMCEYILYLENRLDEMTVNANSHYNVRNQTR